MTTCPERSCSFDLPRVPFVNCCLLLYLDISLFGLDGRIWDLIVSVPDHCLSFYFIYHSLFGLLECLVMSLTSTLEIKF